MKLSRKKSQTAPRKRRVLDTVSEATPRKNIYSSSSSRGQQQEPRRKLKDNKTAPKALFSRIFALGSSSLALLAVIALAAYLLSLSTEPILSTLGDSKSSLQVHDSATYAAAVKTELSKSFWNHNKLTIKTQDIKADLSKQFPELESVNVVVPFFGTKPVVYIEPAQPEIVLTASNGTYILNSTGKVLIMQANLPASVKLDNVPVVTDQSDLRAALNKQALTHTNIIFIKTVIAQLRAKSIPYASLVLPAGASELDVHLGGQPYFVKFNLQSPKTAREQTGTFLAAQQELTNQHIIPGKYIDVRLEGRAFYQ